MSAAPPPRPREQRVADTLHRLRTDVDAWVSTADPGTGTPYLVPLSFLWEDGTLLLSTAAASPTAANLRATGRVRLGLGATRDVVLIEGTVEVVAAADLPTPTGDAFAAATGFDPRALRAPYEYYRVTPVLVQAWREENELAGRDLMREGRWL